MSSDDTEILYASKRKFKNAQIQALIINEDSPYHRVERRLVEIYISQFATAFTDQCLSNISEESLEKRNKLPMPIAFALIQRYLKGGRYAQALKIMHTHVDRKTAERLFVLTYNTAKIYQILGNLKNTVFYLQNLLKQEPFCPYAIYDLALIYSQSFNRSNEALLLLQRHLGSILKDNNMVHSAFLALANNSKLSVQEISKIMANRSLTLTNYFNLALLFKKKGDSEKSTELFQELHEKLIEKQQTFLQRGNLKDIKLIILTKLNLIQLKQTRDDSKLYVANLAYFLLQKYKTYLDPETINNLNQIIEQSNIKTFSSTNSLLQPRDKQASMFHSNLNFQSPRESKCPKNGSFANNKQFNNMRSYSSRKLKYLLQKEREIEKFFKNLTIKQSELPSNIKVSIKNSIQRAKQQINEYKLKQNIDKDEYLRFEEQFEEKKQQKLIELDENEIVKSIQNILTQLHSVNQDSHKNNRKVIMPLNSLLNQKTVTNSGETQKLKSFLVTKRDLLKKCANFKKHKISMNLQLQKNQKRNSTNLKSQNVKTQQCQNIVKHQCSSLSSNISQRSLISKKEQSMKEMMKMEQKENSLVPSLDVSNKHLQQIIVPPVSTQIVQRDAPEEAEVFQQKQQSLHLEEAQNIPIHINEPTAEIHALSFKQLQLQHKKESQQPTSINQLIKIDTELSLHAQPQKSEEVDILGSHKSHSQLLEVQAKHQQTDCLVLPQTASNACLEVPNEMAFQRSHTINLTDSQTSEVFQPIAPEYSQILSNGHMQSLQQSQNSIQKAQQPNNKQNEVIFEADPVLQSANQQSVKAKMQSEKCFQKSETSIFPHNQDPSSEQKLSDPAIASENSLSTHKEQNNVNAGQSPKKEEIKTQDPPEKETKQTAPYDPVASTFQLTGFEKMLLGNFGEKTAPISPAQTLQMFFSPHIKTISAEPSPVIQQKLAQAVSLQKQGNFEEAYKKLTALYKQFKGQAEKQLILLAIGKLFETQHKYEEAERTYFKCTKFNSAETFLRLGSLLLKLGKVQAGIENLQKADCIKRSDLQIENKLVYGYSLREETMNKALNLAHNILKKNPNSIETLIMTAGILQKQGLIKQAIEIVTQIDKVKSTEYIKQYLGILYLEDANLPQAYNSFKGALSIKPDYVPSLIEVASIISDISSKQAIELLNKVLEMEPANRKALARLGKIYESVEGDFESAMRTYQTALDSQQNYESYIKIGDCLAKRQSYIQALLNYKEALNLKKTSEAYAKLALMYEKKTEYPKAIESYQSALNIMKQEQSTLCSLDKKREYLMSIGKLSHKIGQFEAAIASFEEIVEGEESAQLYKLLGQSYFGKRQHEIALQYFQRANNLAKGEDVEILQNLAICLDQLEEYLASKAIYEKILRKDPNNARCLNNLANILLITGQTNQAFETFEILLQKTPKNLEKRLKIADIYAQVGDWSKVEYHLLQCYRLKQHDPRVLQKLVTLYKQKRDMRMVAKYEKKLALRANHRPKPKE